MGFSHLLLAILVASGCALCSTASKCPQRDIVKDVTPDDLAGAYYEFARSGDGDWFDQQHTCISWYFRETVNTTTQEVMPRYFGRKVFFKQAQLHRVDLAELYPGILDVKNPGAKDGKLVVTVQDDDLHNHKVELVVLKTHGYGYRIVAHCDEDTGKETIWILSQSKKPFPDTAKSIFYDVNIMLGLDASKFKQAHQDCPDVMRFYAEPLEALQRNWDN